MIIDEGIQSWCVKILHHELGKRGSRLHHRRGCISWNAGVVLYWRRCWARSPVELGWDRTVVM